MALPVLLITGPVGVGKTSVAFETMELLEERNVAHAFFDLDGLTYVYPTPASDRFGDQFALEALGLLCPRLREQGVAHLILARVLWEPESLTLYRRAIPDAEITVVRLTAPLDVVEERLRRREVGSATEWYLARARECEERWSRDPVGDVLIQTAGRDVRSIAQEILDTLRWCNEVAPCSDAFPARGDGKPPTMSGLAGEPDARYQAHDVEVAVVGAGQAGLAIGYHLKGQGHRFVILERAGEIAPSWRERWESLTLFTPRRYSALPGLSFAGDPDGYPTRNDVIAYLERYAETFELSIELNSEVKELERGGDGRFRLEVDGRVLTADQVVVATGPFQTPFVPPLAETLPADVFQTHAVGYRRPHDVQPGKVVVVGGGNTGFQIAKELSETHDVVLSIGSRQKPLPQRLLGRDLFWWLTKTRILDKTVESRVGRRLSTRDTLIGSSPREMTKCYGVELRPRLVGADGRRVQFEDGSELEADAVIWATGYRPDYSWIKLPIFDEGGRLRHRRGVTDVPGLYFLGLTWQYTRGSALIGFINDDAVFIAEKIADYRQSRAPERASITTGARSIERS